MSIVLQDPTNLETPSRDPVRPVAPLDPDWVTGKREISFELESPGGYRRTVTGTIAYLDDEAHTYMVHTRDDELIRVPLRDVRRTIQIGASGSATRTPVAIPGASSSGRIT